MSEGAKNASFKRKKCPEICTNWDERVRRELRINDDGLDELMHYLELEYSPCLPPGRRVAHFAEP